MSDDDTNIVKLVVWVTIAFDVGMIALSYWREHRAMERWRAEHSEDESGERP